MQAPVRSVRGTASPFVTPILSRGGFGSGNVSTCARTSRRPSRRRGRQPSCRRIWLSCTKGPMPDDDKSEDGGIRDESSKSAAVTQEDSTLERVEQITGTTMTDIDDLAEEWIGADLARWEWYERVKARRERMLKTGRENEEKFGEELQELKRTFMEIDALFGTGMLDERSEISPSGWSTVAIITLLYVCAGFWGFELVVRLLTSVSPSFP